MKIAVEISIFGHTFSDVIDYPGVPSSQAEVIQWLMSKTDFRWADYENAPRDERMLYHLDDAVAH